MKDVRTLRKSCALDAGRPCLLLLYAALAKTLPAARSHLCPGVLHAALPCAFITVVGGALCYDILTLVHNQEVGKSWVVAARCCSLLGV